MSLLGWARIKNDPASVEWYDTEKLRECASSGRWTITETSSVLELRSGADRIMHLQMKGSGGRDYDSPARHGMMFHLYGSALCHQARVSLVRA